MTPRPLPARRFAVLAKRPGHAPTVCTVPPLQTEEDAHATMDRLFHDPAVRAVQYALAELTIVEQYR
jgi:hypothetical protein